MDHSGALVEQMDATDGRRSRLRALRARVIIESPSAGIIEMAWTLPGREGMHMDRGIAAGTALFLQSSLQEDCYGAIHRCRFRKFWPGNSGNSGQVIAPLI